MDSADTVILGSDYPKARAEAQDFVAELAACVNGDAIELPSLPDVALKIRDALARDDADFERLAELTGSDPALAARLMKIANSALFTRGRVPPADIHTAIVRLGSRMVRNTAIAIAAQQVFIGYGSRSIHPDLTRTWRHSLHVAALCHLLLTVKRCEISPDEGFLAGLLHEVGTLFILLRARDHTELWADRNALRSVIDEWQSRVGGRIIEAWEFPEAAVEAVRDHDSRPLACNTPISLADVVAVANYLSTQAAAGDDIELLIAQLPDFGALRLDEDALRFTLETANAEVDSLIAALEPGGKTQAKTVSSA